MSPSMAARIPIVLVCLAVVLAACAEASTTPSPSAAAPSSPPAAASSSPDVTSSATAEASSTPAATASTVARTEEVTVEGSQFVPGQLSISAGTVVTFVNLDAFAHTVTEGTAGQAADDAVADEMLDAGASVEVTFDEPGTYEITCRFHPTMQMTVVVEGD
jgi:plastocyanin